MWCCGAEVVILIDEAEAAIFFDGSFFGLGIPAWRVACYFSKYDVKFCGMKYALLLCRRGNLGNIVQGWRDGDVFYLFFRRN